METDQKNCLTRLDIINTLNSRHLHIPDIENLTYEELLRIFKTFAVPLQQRHVRERCIPVQYWDYLLKLQNASKKGEPVVSAVQSRSEAQQFLERNQITPQQNPHILQQAKYLKLSFNTISNQAPKRFSIHGEELVGGPTPPKRLMILP